MANITNIHISIYQDPAHISVKDERYIVYTDPSLNTALCFTNTSILREWIAILQAEMYKVEKAKKVEELSKEIEQEMHKVEEESDEEETAF